MISFEHFAQCDIRIGLIIQADIVEGADRLIVFSIDVGEEAPRTIVSGIREFYSAPESLIGKRVPVLMNLEPRAIKGIMSEGMVLYVVGDGTLTTLEPAEEVRPGTPVH